MGCRGGGGPAELKEEREYEVGGPPVKDYERRIRRNLHSNTKKKREIEDWKRHGE